MSVRVMSDVWDYGPADPLENAVLLALANHCNDFGQNCFPGITRLAHMTRRTPRTVIRVIQSLEDGDWIRVQHNVFGKKRAGNGYEINIEKLLKSKHHYIATRGHEPPVYEDLHMTRVHVTPVHVTPVHVTSTTFTHDIHDKPPHPHIGVTVKATNTPPSPLSGGMRVVDLPQPRVAQYDHTEDALALVCSELGVTNKRVRLALRDPLLLYKRQNDCSAYDAANAMVSAWRDYIAHPRRLGKPMPLQTFFTQGHWLDPACWWQRTIADMEAFEQYQRATVGSSHRRGT